MRLKSLRFFALLIVFGIFLIASLGFVSAETFSWTVTGSGTETYKSYETIIASNPDGAGGPHLTGNNACKSTLFSAKGIWQGDSCYMSHYGDAGVYEGCEEVENAVTGGHSDCFDDTKRACDFVYGDGRHDRPILRVKCYKTVEEERKGQDSGSVTIYEKKDLGGFSLKSTYKSYETIIASNPDGAGGPHLTGNNACKSTLSSDKGIWQGDSCYMSHYGDAGVYEGCEEVENAVTGGHSDCFDDTKRACDFVYGDGRHDRPILRVKCYKTVEKEGLAKEGGTMENVGYKLTDNSNIVLTWFSDTETDTSTNKNAHVIACIDSNQDGICDISQHQCLNSNDTIMKLYNSTNSYGALWNDTNYNYSICYSEIFGTEYTEANPHQCTGSNRVLSLFSTTNAHAAVAHDDINYKEDVCYGDLSCRADLDSAGCVGWGGQVILSLSQENNSYIAEGDFLVYNYKICCKSGAVASAGNVYWANMLGQRIDEAQIGDTVLMIYEGASSAHNFSIYEDDSYDFFNDGIDNINTGENAIPTFILKDNKAIAKWKITDEDYAKGNSLIDGEFSKDNHEEFYFEVNSSQSSLLNVTQIPANSPPSVRIVSPLINSKFKVRTPISFEQISSDEDDDLSATWDFGDGNITTIQNCLTTGNCNITHSYSNWGTKVIELKVKEMTRTQEAYNYTRVFIYNESINVFAIITEPPFGKIFGQGIKLVKFNASESYVANCTTNTCASCTYNVSDLHCYDLSKSNIGTIPGKYNLWFNWTFSEGGERYGNWADNYNKTVEFSKPFLAPTKHWANLRVGYEPF